MKQLVAHGVTCRFAVRCAMLSLASCVSAVSPARAQRATLFAGGVHARYADSVSGTAATVAAGVSWTSTNASGSGELSVSQFVTGEWAAELSAQGFAVRAKLDPVILGLSFGGRFADYEGGSWSGTGVVGPFVAKPFGSLLTSFAATFGGVRRVDETSLALGTGRLSLRYTAPRGVSVEGSLSGTAADTIRHADVLLSVGFEWERGSVSALFGARAGDLSDDPWAQASVKSELTPSATFEASLGRYPRSISGLTDGLFATAGIRLHIGGAPGRSMRIRDPGAAVESLGGGRVRVTLLHRSAQRLEIAGDWNDWTPVRLTPDGPGRWSVEVALPPGVYEFSIVVDGTEWTVPDGVATVPDEFGGRVALLIVR